MARPDAMSAVATVFVPYLFCGFYQEVVYRGLLQTELVRRWGSAMGILAANVLFTFGPLHENYYLGPAPNLPMIGAIFAIGLLLGVIFRRSGNLWIVAVMHAIGNAYMVFAAPAR
jgi:membrane protease YdiL (CAAX protease family)